MNDELGIMSYQILLSIFPGNPINPVNSGSDIAQKYNYRIKFYNKV
jgi:hypothetical protein